MVGLAAVAPVAAAGVAERVLVGVRAARIAPVLVVRALPVGRVMPKLLARALAWAMYWSGSRMRGGKGVSHTGSRETDASR